MNHHVSRRMVAGVAVTLVTAGLAVASTDMAAHPGAKNSSDMKFATVPGVPTCLQGSVQTGDPMNSAFILYAKANPGCAVPPHWHTANEHLMIVKGTARIALRSQDQGKPTDLQPGGFALLPSKHVHQLKCDGACEFYLYSDGKFDLHYVDPSGEEISPEQALKPLKEVPAGAINK